jgi:hypothetical protein
MSNQRKANVIWYVADENGQTPSVEHAQLAVLMDLRDELQKLNRLLHCQNFTNVPRYLREIRRNTTKRKRKKR